MELSAISNYHFSKESRLCSPASYFLPGIIRAFVASKSRWCTKCNSCIRGNLKELLVTFSFVAALHLTHNPKVYFMAMLFVTLIMHQQIAPIKKEATHREASLYLFLLSVKYSYPFSRAAAPPTISRI